MSHASETAARSSPSAPDAFGGYLNIGMASRWGLLGLLVIATLIVLVQRASPAVVEALSTYSNPSYYRVEAAYLLPPIGLLLLLSLLGFATFVGRLRLSLGFGLASVSLGTVLAVLVADSNTDFATEAGKITIFTTTMLVLCGCGSALNYFSCEVRGRQPRLNQIFWALLTFAFLFAAADEALMIHERLGHLISSGGEASDVASFHAQDAITMFYAVAALAVVSVAGVAIRASRGNGDHIVVFAVAALTYLGSTVLDSADSMLRTPPLAFVDLPHMANTLEEILEFVAAGMFLFGCLLAFLNAPRNEGLTRSIEARIRHWRGASLQLAVATTIALCLALTAAAVLVTPPGGVEFGGPGELALQTFAGARGAPLHPDGMTSSGGRVYVANDAPPSIAALAADSSPETLIGLRAGAHTPESVAVGRDGRIFFTDDSANAVYVIDPRQEGDVATLLSGADGLRSPKGLAIGPDGCLYIADVGASAILRYSAQGQLSVYASALQGIAAPEELAFDSHGNLYVTEDQRRVRKVRPDRTSSIFLGESADFTPEAIAIRNDRIYVTDSVRRAVLEYDLGGRGRALITLPGRLGRTLEGLAVASNGDLWVGLRPTHGIPGAVLRFHARAHQRPRHQRAR